MKTCEVCKCNFYTDIEWKIHSHLGVSELETWENRKVPFTGQDYLLSKEKKEKSKTIGYIVMYNTMEF